MRRDPVELLLVAALCAVAGFAAASYLFLWPDTFWPEDAPAFYEDQFGPAHFSNGVEEWLIRDFFQDKRNGVFLDVGAGHFRDASNTFFLESRLGWSGFAIDAQREYASEYLTQRPRTRFLAAFVSNRDGDVAALRIPKENPQLATSHEQFLAAHGSVTEVREVPTVTLDTVLDEAGVTSIDFMSLDIEMHELEALAGFTIERFEPRLICVEAHLPIRQALLDYFHAHGYVVVGRYLRVDKKNLYFEPAAR